MAITVPNSSSATEGVSTNQVTSSPTWTSTAANLLVVGAGCANSSGGEAATPVDDGGTDTFTANQSPVIGGAHFGNIAFAKNIAGKAGQAATYNTTGGAGDPSVALIEVAGCDTTSPNDVAPSWQTATSGATLNSSLITPAAGDHLLFVCALADGTGAASQSVANNGTGSATWTTIKNDSTSGSPILAAYAVVTADGSHTYAVTYTHGIGTPTQIIVGIAAFKIAGGGTTYTLSGSASQAQSLTLATAVIRQDTPELRHARENQMQQLLAR